MSEAILDPRLGPARAGRLRDAIAFAVARPQPERDLRRVIEEDNTGDRAPEIIGPVRSRALSNGMVLVDGAPVATWGQTDRIDMAFSISKTFISSAAGLAYDRGMLVDLHEPVRRTVGRVDLLQLDLPHNREVTWHHLLQQTSLWRGELWGKPHDAHKVITQDTSGSPGSGWTYNDTRVNVLALALTCLWQRSLRDVVNDHLMRPLGAMDWQWHAYHHAHVQMDGRAIPSVSGGGRWGGGVWISTEALAAYGELHRRAGLHAGEHLVSAEWLELATTPCSLKPTYGYLWWLNTDGGLFRSAPPHGFAAIGVGLNLLWIDPVNNLTIVARWLEHEGTNLEFTDRFLGQLYAALDG